MTMKLSNLIALLLLTSPAFSGNQTNTFPDSLRCKAQPYYKLREDGKPGRAVVLKFIGSKLYGAADVEIIAEKTRETVRLQATITGSDSVLILLPEDIGVKQDTKVSLNLRQGKNKQTQTITVPAMRHWTVYIYPHSHVDIGYSNTQENVEFIHKRNIDQGIKLAEATKDFPIGERYRWNTEVIWPFERYLNSATPERKDELIKSVENGYICLDASYLNVNTSAAGEEELFQLLRKSREIEKVTGKPSDVFVQVDIPGITWGMVPVFAQEGVRYILTMPNSGLGNNRDEKPFWWVGPDGKSKVMVLSPASGYGIGLGKGWTTGRPWFGQLDKAKIPEAIKTDNPRANFLDKHLFSQLPLLEKNHHPYDIYVITWALWDNALVDADLPYAVKSWNEDYAFPHLVIAGAHEIMQTFEKQYGDKLPVVKGDYTEYWTDGIGTAAREASMNRNAKERLLQAETVWTMLHPGQPSPRSDFDEAWRYIMLGTEHTYVYENPNEPMWPDLIWKVKQNYYHEAEFRSQLMLADALAPATDKTNGVFSPVPSGTQNDIFKKVNDYGPTNGGIAVINTLSWPHGGLVTLSREESYAGNRVVDDQEKEVISQRLSSGELVFLASDVPGFGSRHYRVEKGNCSLRGDCKVTNSTLENGLTKVELDPVKGTIISLVDIATGQNFADPKINGGLNAFIWLPRKGISRSDSSAVISIQEAGPLVAGLVVTSKAQGCRSITRSVRLIHGQKWVDISNVVDKLPVLEKEGLHFGFGFNIPQSVTHVDIPWGVVRVEDDQMDIANRDWFTMNHWLDVSNDKSGITWCSPDCSLFEYGKMVANARHGWNGKINKLQQSSIIFSWVMNNHWTTNFPVSQEGKVEFRYSILPHGPYDEVKANRFGVEQSQPLLHLNTNSNPISQPLLEVKNDQITAVILKSTADGKAMIMRLRSHSDKDETAKLIWLSRKPSSVYVCDRGEEAGKTEVKGEVTVPAKGFLVLRAEW